MRQYFQKSTTCPVSAALELTVEGNGFREKHRFNKFTNLPELMNIFREVADVQTPDIAEMEEDWLVISGWYVWIPEHALILRKGIICIRDNESGMHMPDEAVTVMQKGYDDTALFYVRGSFAEAVSLWNDGIVTETEAEELKCRIVCPGK